MAEAETGICDEGVDGWEDEKETDDCEDSRGRGIGSPVGRSAMGPTDGEVFAMLCCLCFLREGFCVGRRVGR
jgi:hypothetical protein